MEIADYFEMRAAKVQEQLDAFESGKILGCGYKMANGETVDMTERYKEELRQHIRNYQQAAARLRPAPTPTFDP